MRNVAENQPGLGGEEAWTGPQENHFYGCAFRLYLYRDGTGNVGELCIELRAMGPSVFVLRITGVKPFFYLCEIPLGIVTSIWTERNGPL